MKKIVTMTIASALLGFSSIAHAGTEASLTEDQVTELKKAWGDGIVKIGKVHTAGGDYRNSAREHIERFYAYGKDTVLFKPTLASQDQFRGTFDEALSYFVGGKIAEDGGFAIAPYTAVRWESEGINITGNTALTMGNYYFTKTDGSEVKVEYTFGFEKLDGGDVKIVLHHSSLPFSPQKES
ncbi:MAG: phosphoribosyl-AMP cyclohydrolase [Pseudomonadota bacterium]